MMHGSVELFKFYPLESALRNLASKRLKISRVEELNDPFELECCQFTSDLERRKWADMKKSMSSDLGLVCFCKDFGNPLMWAHYADNHQGLSLGFKVSTKNACEVKYISEPEIGREAFSLLNAANEKFLKVLATKFDHWAYEKEWRIFSKIDKERSSEMQFEEFSDDLELASVTIGAKSWITKTELASFVSPTIKILKAAKAMDSFSIVASET